MQFHTQKNFLIYLISRVFLPGLFLNFLAYCPNLIFCFSLTVMFCFICTFSSWITVYKCYYQFKEGSGYDQHSAGGYGNSSDGQLTQPLLSSSAAGPGPAPPPLPPNHPSAGTSYQLGQYPQYYPPHGNRALPSAPPNIYPSLANA